MSEIDFKLVGEISGLALLIFGGGKAWSHALGKADAARREAHGVGASLDALRNRVEGLERSQSATDRELQIRAGSNERQFDRLEEGVRATRDELGARIVVLESERRR